MTTAYDSADDSKARRVRWYLFALHPALFLLTALFVLRRLLTTRQLSPGAHPLGEWLTFTVLDAVWVAVGVYLGARLSLESVPTLVRAKAYLWLLVGWAALEYYLVFLYAQAFGSTFDDGALLIRYVIPKIIVGAALINFPPTPPDQDLL